MNYYYLAAMMYDKYYDEHYDDDLCFVMIHDEKSSKKKERAVQVGRYLARWEILPFWGCRKQQNVDFYTTVLLFVRRITFHYE